MGAIYTYVLITRSLADIVPPPNPTGRDQPQFHDRSGWSYAQLVRSKRVSSYSFIQVKAAPIGGHTEPDQIKREYNPVLLEEARAVEGPWGSDDFPVGSRKVHVAGDISAEICPA